MTLFKKSTAAWAVLDVFVWFCIRRTVNRKGCSAYLLFLPILLSI